MTMAGKSFRLAALLLLPPWLGAASAAPDLELVSVLEVDYFDQTEIPSPSASAFSRFLTDQQMVRTGVANPYEERPHRALLKVELISQIDLAGLVRNDYSVRASAFFCRRPNDVALLSLGAVYQEGIRLTKASTSGTKGGAQKNNYHVFLNVAYDATAPSNPPMVSFDLRTRPEDICIVVSGSRVPFSNFKSSTMTVSAQVIAEATRKSKK